MKLYLDTSSLFKLYHLEPGTEEIDNVFIDNEVSGIFLSAITNVEFISAVFKRVRMKELSMNNAEEIIKLFDDDLIKYTIVPVSSKILEAAKLLIFKYGQDGLRTLDALQFASAIEVKNMVNKYFTADKLLLTLFEKEYLPTL